MKLLVTGGAGYIGSVVAAQLLEADHEVTVLDDLSTGHRDAVPAGAHFVEADIADSAKVVTADFDGVLHFAAKSLVGESQQRPELYWRTNVAGTLALLDALRHAGVRRIVFSSTAATYGEPDTVPIDETAPTAPTNTYGHSKLAVDRMLGGEALAHGLGAVSLRYFNVAGAHGGFGERHAVETHLIPIALQVAAGEREQLVVYGEDWPTPDGTCVRDYIHVADLAGAHLLAVQACEPGSHRIYNLGNGAGFSVREVIEAARRVTGHPIPVEVGPRRPGDPAVLVASSERIRAELGWEPAHPEIDVMVADAWEFIRSRM
ncbi:MAG: UDP-glucose 4-epimerase GalE [Geodermatophilaceae bacterium]|nr:UDP-glucose 4-epimerase GalE [Geodermatophilaceae bacterium]MDQ3466460.1 UDP-glucose 4-epimerase GalE [Actinomycetota bacterium]